MNNFAIFTNFYKNIVIYTNTLNLIVIFGIVASRLIFNFERGVFSGSLDSCCCFLIFFFFFEFHVHPESLFYEWII